MNKLRLDKLLCDMGCGTRSQIGKLIRGGSCSVNGAMVKDPAMKVDGDSDEILLSGERIIYRQFTYIMLNKPEGVISATDDRRERTVLSLLPERLQQMDIFPAGRLDKDTLGLVILTNDGAAAHRQLSPRYHAEKVYRFKCESELKETATRAFAAGVTLEDGTLTRPAKLQVDEGRRSGEITLTEGMYHEIKRMFESVGNKITYLERISFAGIELDPALQRGQWRYLSEQEERLFTEGSR